MSLSRSLILTLLMAAAILPATADRLPTLPAAETALNEAVDAGFPFLYGEREARRLERAARRKERRIRRLELKEKKRAARADRRRRRNLHKNNKIQWRNIREREKQNF